MAPRFSVGGNLANTTFHVPMQHIHVAAAAAAAAVCWSLSSLHQLKRQTYDGLFPEGDTMVSCRADSITWDMVAKEAETGKAYLHKHKDVNGQPVIVIRSSLHVTGTANIMGSTL